MFETMVTGSSNAHQISMPFKKMGRKTQRYLIDEIAGAWGECGGPLGILSRTQNVRFHTINRGTGYKRLTSETIVFGEGGSSKLVLDIEDKIVGDRRHLTLAPRTWVNGCEQQMWRPVHIQCAATYH